MQSTQGYQHGARAPLLTLVISRPSCDGRVEDWVDVIHGQPEACKGGLDAVQRNHRVCWSQVSTQNSKPGGRKRAFGLAPSCGAFQLRQTSLSKRESVRLPQLATLSVEVVRRLVCCTTTAGWRDWRTIETRSCAASCGTRMYVWSTNATSALGRFPA